MYIRWLLKKNSWLVVHRELKKMAFFGYSFIYKMRTESCTKIIQCFLKNKTRQLSKFVNESFLRGFGHRFSGPYIFLSWIFPGWRFSGMADMYIYIYIYIYIYLYLYMYIYTPLLIMFSHPSLMSNNWAVVSI